MGIPADTTRPGLPGPPLAGGRVSYLIATVADLPPTVAFYRQLGFLESYAMSGECTFLRLPGTEGPQLGLYAADPGGETAGWMLAFDVPNLDRSLASLSSRGLSTTPVGPVPFGRAATVVDPAGLRVELHEPAR